MHEVEAHFRATLGALLNRSRVINCSSWAETYRVMGAPYPGPWTFRYHPWLRQIHDDPARRKIVRKAAQMGFTEWALNLAFYSIDMKGESVLYILPNATPDASDFSSARFGAALELSPHLSRLFSETSNVGHKRAGAANLYIRGSQAKGPLKSVPVAVTIADEVDEMNQDNIALVSERLAGQTNASENWLSTPTIPGYGIDSLFKTTDQKHYFFPCPSCSRMIELDWPRNIVITADSLTDPRINDCHYICHECKAVLPHAAKPDFLADGEWVAEFPDRPDSGYWIPQLCSTAPAADPIALVKKYLLGMANVAFQADFYNSKLGKPHVVAGSQVQDIDLQVCTANYKMGEYKPGLIRTMGIDVGRIINYEICEWLITGEINETDPTLNLIPRVIQVGETTEFEKLDLLIAQNKVTKFVIDANPEYREATKLCHRFPGRGYISYYVHSIQARHMSVNLQERALSVNRTSWLDLSLGRFKTKTIQLPYDIPETYKQHIKAPIRQHKVRERAVMGAKGGTGTGTGVTETTVIYTAIDPDHYAHARNYAEMAMAIHLLGGTTQDIRS